MAQHPLESDDASPLEVHPRASIRREPFGALVYHYDTRQLVFLNDPILVGVIEALGRHDSVADALDEYDIGAARRPSFVAALDRLRDAGVLRERPRESNATTLEPQT